MSYLPCDLYESKLSDEEKRTVLDETFTKFNLSNEIKVKIEEEYLKGKIQNYIEGKCYDLYLEKRKKQAKPKRVYKKAALPLIIEEDFTDDPTDI